MGPNLNQYDKIIVCYSGGKDSTACLLNLIDQGVSTSKIELWHHDIDGRAGQFMDWAITPDYCNSFALAFGVPIYHSWRTGGFYREMMRQNQRTAAVQFETPGGNIKQAGGINGKESTRMKFPQVSADLSVRWCSSSLKIDVCAAAIRNQNRFNWKKTLVITGERGEESPARAKYKVFEPHRSDLRNGRKIQRHIDHWRPLIDWEEKKVWDIIEKYKVRVHPCYYIGFGRCSCLFCIFGNKNQFKSAQAVWTGGCEKICQLEEKFGCTIKRKSSVRDLLKAGVAYQECSNSSLLELAQSYIYDKTIFIDNWQLPSGAFGESDGPT